MRKNDSDSPDSSSKRLEKALSGISTSEMRAVRAEVQGELNSLSPQAQVPSLRAGIIPPPPAKLVEAAQARDKAMGADAEKERPSDIKDLKRASKIAEEFMTGMDQIQNVLLLLVLKFGRASTLTRAVFWGILVSVALLGANLLLIWNISVSQTSLQREQEKIQEQQARILEKQRDTQLAAGEARQKAEAAAQKADEIQQKAPEVVIDSRGKPQLILKVQNPSEGEQATKTLEPPPRSKIKDESTGQTLEVPLKF